MELLLNIVWLLLSLSLVFLWKRGVRRFGTQSKLPDLRIQLIALALLVVILLPVISMTDDIQAISTAEIEHVTRKVDMAPVAEQPASLADHLHVGLFLSFHLTGLHSFMRLEPAVQIAKPLIGSIRQAAKRPPPLFA